MQRECARPGARTDFIQTRDEPGQVQLLSVLIQAQMRVRIHDDGARGEQIINLSHQRPIRIGGIHERILAGCEVPDALAHAHRDRSDEAVNRPPPAAIFVHVEVDSCGG
jgi:hypothetical protein